MIETMSVQEAVKRLRSVGIRICAQTLRDGIEQGAFPFGTCYRVRDSKRRVCRVYTRKLEEWIREKEA